MKNLMISIMSIILIGMGFTMTGCSSVDLNSSEVDGDAMEGTEAASQYHPIEISESHGITVDRTNGFAADLTEVLNNDGQSNVFCSPISIGNALAAIAVGAYDNTLTEILCALKVEEVDQLKDFYKNIIPQLILADNQTRFTLNNSLWFKKKLNLRDDYIQALTDSFGVETYITESDRKSIINAINAWVSNATEGIINDFLDESFNRDVVMALINAVYFKGKWKNEFNSEETKEGVFTCSNGKMSNVQFMHLDNACMDYINSEELKAVKLPYGNTAFEFIVALPGNIKSTSDIINKICDRTTGWRNGMIKLALPKFRIEYECDDLIKYLKRLGISELFTPAANLKGISDEEIFFNAAIHKSVLEIDESGAEAAAASGFMIITSPGDYLDEGLFEFDADRPFTFIIRERSTGAILFSGVVNQL